MSPTIRDVPSLVAPSQPYGWKRALSQSTLAALLVWLALEFLAGVAGVAATRFGTRIIDELTDGFEAIVGYVDDVIGDGSVDTSPRAVQALCDAAAHARVGAPGDAEQSFELFARYHRALSLAERRRLDARLERTLEVMIASSDTDGAIRTYRALFADLLSKCTTTFPSHI